MAGLFHGRGEAFSSPLWDSVEHVVMAHPDLLPGPTGMIHYSLEMLLNVIFCFKCLSTYLIKPNPYSPITGSLIKNGQFIFCIVRASTSKCTTAPQHPVSALNNLSLKPNFTMEGPDDGSFVCTVSVQNNVSINDRPKDALCIMQFPDPYSTV